MPTWPLEILFGDGAPGNGRLPRAATLVYVTALVRETTVRALTRAAERGAAVACVHVGLEDPPELPGIRLHDYRDRFDTVVNGAPRGRRDGVLYA
jgi:hypothetical protein